MHPNINFIIVNYRNFKDSIDCIKSILKACEYKMLGLSINVIDNNSGNRSIENIAMEFKDTVNVNFQSFKTESLNLYKSEKNLGFGEANNTIIKEIQSGNVFLINPDIVIEKDLLSELVKCTIKKNTIYGFPTYNYYHQNQLLFFGGYQINKITGRVKPNLNLQKKVDYINGSGFLAHHSVFKATCFDNQYFLYWEDADFCLKSQAEMQVLKNCILFDKISTTIGKGFVSEYYYQRNKLLFFKKNYPQKVILVMIFLFPAIILRIIRGRKEHVSALIKGFLDYSNGRVGKMV